MKLWEAEFLALNFVNGTIEKVISTHYFLGVNMEQAQRSLVQAGMPWLRLTGNWFSTQQDALNYNQFYEVVKDPHTIVKGMTYDDFNDWLELGTKEDIESAIEAFKEAGGLEDHIKVMEVHIKLKYGDKDEEEG